MRRTKTTTIEWHTGKPTHSGTYLCIAGSVDNMGRLQPYGVQSVYILHYSQTHHAWGMHDWDDPQRQTVRWDDVRAWAPLTTSLQALRGWHIEQTRDYLAPVEKFKNEVGGTQKCQRTR